MVDAPPRPWDEPQQKNMAPSHGQGWRHVKSAQDIRLCTAYPARTLGGLQLHLSVTSFPQETLLHTYLVARYLPSFTRVVLSTAVFLSFLAGPTPQLASLHDFPFVVVP